MLLIVLLIIATSNILTFIIASMLCDSKSREMAIQNESLKRECDYWEQRYNNLLALKKKGA